MFFTPYRHVLHKYANEDVSLGSWFIGLDVQHIDDRRLCCGTPPGKLTFTKTDYHKLRNHITLDYTNILLSSSPHLWTSASLTEHFFVADCEWKAQAGNICVASFDWTCSGICRSVGRIREVHERCREDEKALWNAAFWILHMFVKEAAASSIHACNSLHHIRIQKLRIHWYAARDREMDSRELSIAVQSKPLLF